VNARTTPDLDRIIARRHLYFSTVAAGPLPEALGRLRQWQAARLASSYADFAGNPRYASAVEFFLEELYGTKHFEARNRDLSRALPLLRRTLPEAPLLALGRVLELELITAELDLAMAKELPAGTLDVDTYASAYRKVGQRELRARQIELAIDAGQDLERAVRQAWVGPLLKAARLPAHAAGFGVLQDFNERGFRAFQVMDGASELLAAIRVRETALMDALFCDAPDPLARCMPVRQT
jgi:hypothetical protein